MYKVPHNVKPISQWPVFFISMYYGVVGTVGAIPGCYFLMYVIWDHQRILHSNNLANTLWFSLIFLANMSRLGLFIGLIRLRRWAYWCTISIETITIISAVYISLSFTRNHILNWIIISIGIIALVILGYLFRPKVWRTFLAVEE
ncbi:hypothetical protein [Herpetosiphon llansteffanensis]|uniref:hypothetical protein n=1 Tax=Herpetosiphon llansteffanensis TaxID=2094568 RepID=UPI000D7CE252|nr:hypothetical protein [Herpetosiphon llansteffanensis]